MVKKKGGGHSHHFTKNTLYRSQFMRNKSANHMSWYIPKVKDLPVLHPQYKIINISQVVPL